MKFKKSKKQKMSIIFLSSFISLFTSFSVYADVNSDLSSYFNSLGFSSNVTSPNVYQGQQAGYYTGGSVFARDSVRDVQIAQVDLPSYRSGCGGIDLFTGGLSFVNSQQLVSTFKSVMSNAQSYAFNLALESATPEIANSMKYINSLAADVNKMNINSCETAAGLVGSVWPKTHEAQQQVCEDIGTSQSIFADYAAAHQGCGAGGQMASTLDAAKGSYANLAMKSGNIAWIALNQNSFLKNDPELAQFFMSLSGTIIIQNPGKDDNTQNSYQVLSSLASDQQLLKALLHGGQAQIYSCGTDTTECLNPSVQTVTIAPSDALESQVNTLLNDMVDKIYSDQPLTQTEIGLLNATRLPLYKMLNVQAAFAGNRQALDVTDYSDVIATDILFQYLDESLNVIKTSASSLQYPEVILAQFQKGLDAARKGVNDTQKNAYQQVTMSLQLIEQTQSIEKMLAGSLSSQLSSNLQWANNMKSED